MNEQETDLVAMLQRMQQQLTFLEKKIDTLVQQSQSQSKPFNRDRGNFSKPFRSFRRPDRPGQGHGGHGHGHGHSFGHGNAGHGAPRHEANGNFVPKAKPHFGRRRERE